MHEIMIFSDFACPFCYIGFSIMDRLRKEDQDIDFLFIPSILNPHTPEEGSSLYDHVDKNSAQLAYIRIEGLAREYGLNYKNKEWEFNTNRINRAGIFAYESDKYFAFARLAFKYIFEYGKNVAKKEVVDEIAGEVGLDIEEMNKKIYSKQYDNYMEDAVNLGLKYQVDSVPTFVVDGVKKPTELKNYGEFKKELLG